MTKRNRAPYGARFDIDPARNALWSGKSLHVVSFFAVIGQIQTFFLSFIARTNTDGVLEYEQDHQGHYARPHQGGAYRNKLALELSACVKCTDGVSNVVVYARATQSGIHEDTCSQRTDDATYAVHPKGIQCIVIPQQGLQFGG